MEVVDPITGQLGVAAALRGGWELKCLGKQVSGGTQQHSYSFHLLYKTSKAKL